MEKPKQSPEYSRDIERVVQFLSALNTAAASLQKSVHSEEEVYRVFKELSKSMNLVCSLSLLTEDDQKFVIKAIGSPNNFLSKLETLTGLSIEGFKFDTKQSQQFWSVLETGQALFAPHNSKVIAELLPYPFQGLADFIIGLVGNLPLILAPITIDQKTVGVLTSAGKNLTEIDLPAIEAFANHLSVAIHNSRLFSATRRQAQELELLNRVRTALANEVELPALLRNVVEAISDTFGYALVSLYLVEGDELVLQHEVGYSNLISRVSITKGVMGRVVRTGQAVLLEDVHQDPTFIGAISNIVSEVCVPIFDQDNVVGILNVESIGDVTLGQPDLKLMVALAEHINVAIRRTRLYDTLQRRENRLRTQRQALIVLATNTALVEAGLDAALHEILKTTAQTLEVDRASVWISQSKTIFTCRGLFSKNDQPYTIGEEFSINHYPAYFKALENDRAIAANNCRQDPRTAELSSTYYEPFGTTSVLDAPIRLNGQLVGVISHEHVGPIRTWEDEEEVFAASIADLIALLSEARERRNTEEALRQVQKLESLGILAGGVAHDFNNLLVAMLGQTTLALKKLPPESPVRPHIEKATNAAKRAADLTRQLLAYSGRGQFEVRPFQLNTLIEENLHLLQVALPKNAALESRLTKSIPLIEGDTGQIQQVIMNLIINGAESLSDRPGIVTISTGLVEVNSDDTSYSHYTAHTLDAGQYVEIQVQDTGPGIQNENLARIFDPFFTTKDTGRGLGLAAVLGIVRGHGGGLKVNSHPGQGTTFQLLFPVSDAILPDTPGEKPDQNSQIEGYVLIIDDEEPVREAITDILEMENIPVMTAENGTIGIQLYDQHHAEIRVVLLDLSMPGLNGVDTLRQLQAINPNIQVVLSSGYSEHDVAGRFSDIGILPAFLKKPYSANDLINLLRSFLGSND